MMGIVETGDDSVTWNEKAMARAEQSKNPQARKWLGALYNNLGWTYHDQKKDPARALALFRKALSFQEAMKQPREIRIARWSVAKALRSLGKVEEALTIQQALQKEWAEAGEPDGYVFEELGECLLALHREAEARPWFKQAYALLSKDAWTMENEAARMARIQELSKTIP
jgi:tetratricopeptide (TPR) repeat protein